MSVGNIGARATTTKIGGWTLVDFTTVGSTTWSVPSGITVINAMLLGGGGGGGGAAFENGTSNGDTSGGGGGGGGGILLLQNINTAYLSTYSKSLPLTIGAGGSGGAAISTGSNSINAGNAGSVGGTTYLAGFAASGGGGGSPGITNAGNVQSAGGSGGSTFTIVEPTAIVDPTSQSETIEIFNILLNESALTSADYLSLSGAAGGGSGTSNRVTTRSYTDASPGGTPSFTGAWAGVNLFTFASSGIVGTGTASTQANSRPSGNTAVYTSVGGSTTTGFAGGGGGGGCCNNGQVGTTNSNANVTCTRGATGSWGGGAGQGAQYANGTALSSYVFTSTGLNGAANTGGGGGGAGSTASNSSFTSVTAPGGGNGGSGRIIIWYRS